MIKLSEKNITVLREDGSKVFFDPVEMQSRIIRSCVEAGVRDPWIAEDLSLSIEFALGGSESGSRSYSETEINDIVVRVLEETGYANVAEKYRVDNHVDESETPSDPATLSNIFSKHLALSGARLSETVEKVRAAVAGMGITSAPPPLYLELARYFRRRELKAGAVPAPPRPPKKASNSNWLVSRDEIMDALKAETRRLVELGIVDVCGISRLFPSLRVELRISKLSEHLGLEPPVAELSLAQHMGPPAGALNDIFAAAAGLCPAAGLSAEGGVPPVCLCVPDMSSFARSKMGFDGDDCGECLEDMLSYLTGALDYKIFKLDLK